MPSTVILQGPTPSWALDIQWPWRHNQGAGAESGKCAMIGGQTFVTAQVTTTLSRDLQSFDQAGGGATRVTGRYRGMFAERWETVAAILCHTWGNIPLFPAIGPAVSFPPGVTTLPHQRAVWISFTLAPDAGAILTSASGVAVINSPAALLVQNWPGFGGGVVANAGGFGIFGNGAGGLNFTAYDATTPGPGGVLTQVAIPAPPAAGDWQSFDFFITGGSGARDATVDVYVGGQLLPGATQLRFTNLAGGCWWNPAATNVMQLALRHGTLGAGNGIRFAYWRIRTGSFTRDGVELTT